MQELNLKKYTKTIRLIQHYHILWPEEKNISYTSKENLNKEDEESYKNPEVIFIAQIKKIKKYFY